MHYLCRGASWRSLFIVIVKEAEDLLYGIDAEK